MSLILGMASLPNYLAGNGDLGSWEPTQLFAGEADIVTDGGVVAVAFAKYQVIAKDATGKLIPFDPTTPDVPAATAIGIANEAGVVGSYAPYYIGGVFNHEALVWPAAVDTLLERQAVFDRTNIHIGNLY
jgi:hypothetical protein